MHDKPAGTRVALGWSVSSDMLHTSDRSSSGLLTPWALVLFWAPKGPLLGPDRARGEGRNQGWATWPRSAFQSALKPKAEASQIRTTTPTPIALTSFRLKPEATRDKKIARQKRRPGLKTRPGNIQSIQRPLIRKVPNPRARESYSISSLVNASSGSTKYSISRSSSSSSGVGGGGGGGSSAGIRTCR